MKSRKPTLSQPPMRKLMIDALILEIPLKYDRSKGLTAPQYKKIVAEHKKEYAKLSNEQLLKLYGGTLWEKGYGEGIEAAQYSMDEF
jgi:hypothetical protein